MSPEWEILGYELEGLNYGKHSISQVHVSSRNAEMMATFENHLSKMQDIAMGKKRKENRSILSC